MVLILGDVSQDYAHLGLPNIPSLQYLFHHMNSVRLQEPLTLLVDYDSVRPERNSPGVALLHEWARLRPSLVLAECLDQQTSLSRTLESLATNINGGSLP
jgi:hypothetical protein